MVATENERIVLDVLHAIEQRDLDRMARLQHPEIWFLWPPGLPYSGRFQGETPVAEMTACFARVWAGLQPTEAERGMDASVVASHESTVVTHYTWRGLDAAGRRFEASTLARYEVRDGLLAGAQMYHFDLTGLIAFLAAARSA